MKNGKKLASAADGCYDVRRHCSQAVAEKKKQADSGDTIKVGAAFELTGNVANYGKSINEGFKLAVDELNKTAA